MTNAEQFIQKEAAIKAAIVERFGLVEIENYSAYNEFQLKMGTAYLMWWLPADEAARTAFEKSENYWKWWRICWTNRDEVFLMEDWHTQPIKVQMAIWKETHCARDLVQEIQPKGVVVAEGLKALKQYEMVLTEK